jgi:hypothetical protein
MAGHRRATARLLASREHREDRPLLDRPPQAPPSPYDGRPRPADGGAARLARLASFSLPPEGGGPTDDDLGPDAPGVGPPRGRVTDSRPPEGLIFPTEEDLDRAAGRVWPMEAYRTVPLELRREPAVPWPLAGLVGLAAGLALAWLAGRRRPRQGLG